MRQVRYMRFELLKSINLKTIHYAISPSSVFLRDFSRNTCSMHLPSSFPMVQWSLLKIIKSNCATTTVVQSVTVSVYSLIHGKVFSQNCILTVTGNKKRKSFKKPNYYLFEYCDKILNYDQIFVQLFLRKCEHWNKSVFFPPVYGTEIFLGAAE